MSDTLLFQSFIAYVFERGPYVYVKTHWYCADIVNGIKRIHPNERGWDPVNKWWYVHTRHREFVLSLVQAATDAEAEFDESFFSR